MSTRVLFSVANDISEQPLIITYRRQGDDCTVFLMHNELFKVTDLAGLQSIDWDLKINIYYSIHSSIRSLTFENEGTWLGRWVDEEWQWEQLAD